MPSIGSVFGGRPEQRPISDSPLDEWLRARDLSRYAFAKQLRVSARTVILWCNNQALPDLVNSFKIQQATDGGVTPEMWLGTDLAKFQWGHDRHDAEAAKAAKRKDNRVQYRRRMRRGT